LDGNGNPQNLGRPCDECTRAQEVALAENRAALASGNVDDLDDFDEADFDNFAAEAENPQFQAGMIAEHTFYRQAMELRTNAQVRDDDPYE
jgi:hypothetical protein